MERIQMVDRPSTHRLTRTYLDHLDKICTSLDYEDFNVADLSVRGVYKGGD